MDEEGSTSSSGTQTENMILFNILQQIRYVFGLCDCVPYWLGYRNLETIWNDLHYKSPEPTLRPISRTLPGFKSLLVSIRIPAFHSRSHSHSHSRSHSHSPSRSLSPSRSSFILIQSPHSSRIRICDHLSVTYTPLFGLQVSSFNLLDMYQDYDLYTSPFQHTPTPRYLRYTN